MDDELYQQTELDILASIMNFHDGLKQKVPMDSQEETP